MSPHSGMLQALSCGRECSQALPSSHQCEQLPQEGWPRAPWAPQTLPHCRLRLSVKGLRSVSLFCAVSSGFSLVPPPPLLLEHLRFPGRMQRCFFSACPALAPSLTRPVLPVRAGSAAAPLLQSPATAQVTGKGRSTPGTPRPHPCHARGPTRGCLCTKVGNSLPKTQPNRVPRCPNLPGQGAVGTGGSAQLSCSPPAPCCPHPTPP